VATTEKGKKSLSCGVRCQIPDGKKTSYWSTKETKEKGKRYYETSKMISATWGNVQDARNSGLLSRLLSVAKERIGETVHEEKNAGEAVKDRKGHRGEEKPAGTGEAL